MVAVGFGLIACSVIVLPIELLPIKSSATGRALIGMLMLIAGGALVGRAFLA